MAVSCVVNIVEVVQKPEGINARNLVYLEIIGGLDSVELWRWEMAVDGEGGRPVFKTAIGSPFISNQKVGEDCEAIVRAGNDGLGIGDGVCHKGHDAN